MRVLRWLHRIEDGVIIAILFLMVALAVAQIFLRNVMGTSVVWIDPMLQNSVLWIGVLGAMIASRKDEHIRVDLVSHYLSDRWKRWLILVVDLFTCGVCGVVAWYSANYLSQNAGYLSPAFGNVPGWMAQIIIPFGFAVISVRYAWLCFLGILGKRPVQAMEDPLL